MAFLVVLGLSLLNFFHFNFATMKMFLITCSIRLSGSQTVLGNHEQVLPIGEHHNPAEECDPSEEAHHRQHCHILAVAQIELGCAKQDGKH